MKFSSQKQQKLCSCNGLHGFHNFFFYILYFTSPPHRTGAAPLLTQTSHELHKRSSRALYIYILFYIFVSVFHHRFFSFAFIFSRFSCRVFVCHGFFYCFSLPLLAGCALCKSETRMVSMVLTEGRGQSTAHKSGWNHFTSHSPRSQSRTLRLSRKTHTLFPCAQQVRHRAQLRCVNLDATENTKLNSLSRTPKIFSLHFPLSGIVKMRMPPTLKSATLSTRSSADCRTHIQCCFCYWDKCLSSCAETQSLRRAEHSRAPINFAKKKRLTKQLCALSRVCRFDVFQFFFQLAE